MAEASAFIDADNVADILANFDEENADTLMSADEIACFLAGNSNYISQEMVEYGWLVTQDILLDWLKEHGRIPKDTPNIDPEVDG